MTTKTAPKNAAKPAAKPVPKQHHVRYTIVLDLPPQVGGKAPTQKALLDEGAKVLALFPGAKGTVAVKVRDARGAQRLAAEARRRVKQRKARRAAATPERNTATVGGR